MCWGKGAGGAKVHFVPFTLNTPLLKIRLPELSVRSGPHFPWSFRPPRSSVTQHDLAIYLLTHNGGFPYTPAYLKQVLAISSPSPKARFRLT